MKSKLMAAMLVAALLAGGTSLVQANEWGKTPEEQQKHLNSKVEKLTKELNLTQDQQSTVRSALVSKMEKIQSAQADADRQIKATLNTEQAKKYDEMDKTPTDKMKKK